MVAKGQKSCYHGNLTSHFSTLLQLDTCREDPSLAIRVKAKIWPLTPRVTMLKIYIHPCHLRKITWRKSHKTKNLTLPPPCSCDSTPDARHVCKNRDPERYTEFCTAWGRVSVTDARYDNDITVPSGSLAVHWRQKWPSVFTATGTANLYQPYPYTKTAYRKVSNGITVYVLGSLSVSPG